MRTDAATTTRVTPSARRPDDEKAPLGWYSRGYHPHLDAPTLLQSVNFRLADSVPRDLLCRWLEERDGRSDASGKPTRASAHPVDAAGNEGRVASLERLVARFEDAGYGGCHLRRPDIAALVQDAFLFGDGDRYRLVEWCVMPNHVHVLMEPLRDSLPVIVQTWKSVTARRANRLLGRTGQLWMRDYYDRYIRDLRHFEAVRRYIWLNPVQAGLCRSPAEWPWSSARLRSSEEVQRVLSLDTPTPP